MNNLNSFKSRRYSANKKDFFEEKKARAFGQIFLLILGIVAFGFILNSEVKVVNAAVYSPPTVPSFSSPGIINTPAEAGKTPLIESIAVSTFGLKTGVALYKVATGVSTVATVSAEVVWAAESVEIATAALEGGWGTAAELTAAKAELAAAKGTWGVLKTSAAGSIATAAMYAYAGAAATKMLFKLIGSNRRNMDTAEKVGTYVALAATATVAVISIGVAAGATAGVFAGAAAAVAAGGSALSGIAIASLSGGPLVFVAVVVIATIITFALRKTFSQEIFSYQITLWQPAPKGEECQKCNSLEYGCSEYQCKSYGKACVIVNPGTTYELCDWDNEFDMDYPIIDTLDILPQGYTYNPDPTVELQDTGVVLEYNGGCLPAFEGIKFGIQTNEPAECKIDIEGVYDYDNMLWFMAEGSLSVINHTFSIPNIALPSAYAINEAGLTLDEGNNYEFYMRCKDVNDNTSPFNFVVKFCIDDGPDTTAPTISTNYINGAYIRSDQVEINDLEVYTNEPAECRWDFLDKSYQNMANNMTDCSMTSGDYTFPASYSYGCRTTLTGVKNDELNSYYIRCEDKPGLAQDSEERRISNQESYRLDLQGTNGLVIDEIIINQEKIMYTADGGSVGGIVISDSTQEIQIRIDVLTSQGAGKQGDARCSYSESGYSYEFYNNQNYDYTPINNHNWYLTERDYDFDITCCDLANNCDSVNINFEVETDAIPPQIARSYYEDGLMKLVTNEESVCVYSLSTCNYLVEDGLKIDTNDFLNHFVSWDEKESFYVKCNDIYGNYPDPSECSIVVRAQYEYEDTASI